MIRTPTNIQTKEVKAYRLSGFRGVDFSTNPLNVKESRSPESQNWIYDCGGPAKRHGWNQFAGIGNYKVNGVYEYAAGYLLVFAGTKAFVVRILATGIGYTATEISLTGTGITITDQRVQFYAQSSTKIFIVGAGLFLVWHYYSAAWHLELVFDNTITYMPTTTISLDYIGYSGTSVTATLERPNLMNKWRKNTCRGVVGSNAESPIVEREYRLDGLAYVGEDGLKYDDGANSVPSAFVTIHYLDGSNAEQTMELKGYYLYNGTPGATQITELVETYGGTKYGEIDGTGKLTLTGVITEPPTNDDNITVTFMCFEQSTANDIESAKFGVLYGVNGITSQLFVGGNTAHPNRDYYSYPLDFSYWPDNYYRNVGNSAITGYHRIADGALVIFKAKQAGEAAIFLRTGTLTTDETTGYYNAVIAYTEKAGYASNYLVSRGTIDTLAGDPVYLSSTGLKGIELSENVSTDERFARRRSYFIDKKLEDYTLTDAQAYVLDDRYYLSMEDVCFVADARLKAAGEMGDTFNYEWMFWDNIPAYTFFELDGVLGFGTDDGRLCIFDDEYTDRTFEGIDSTDLSPHAADDNIVYDPSVVLADGDHIRFTENNLYETALTSADASRTANKITATGTAAKARVLIMNELEEMLLVAADESNVTVYAKNVDYGDYSFELVDVDDVAINMSSGYTTYCLIEPLDGADLYVTDLDTDAKTFKVARHSDTGSISLTYYSLLSPNLDDTKVFTAGAIIITEENVVAEWFSCVSNLGSSFLSKTIESLTVVGTGEMTFGYLTRLKDLALTYDQKSSFSFTDMDFTLFTFSAVTESMTRRVNERNINFVVFEIISDSPTAATINEITARFHYNNVNRGVL